MIIYYKLKINFEPLIINICYNYNNFIYIQLFAKLLSAQYINIWSALWKSSTRTFTSQPE